MDLTLKRAYGSFFLNGAFLLPDSRQDPPAYQAADGDGGPSATFAGIAGYIDFTARSTGQQRLLTDYDSTQTPDTITCAVIYSGTTY